MRGKESSRFHIPAKIKLVVGGLAAAGLLALGSDSPTNVHAESLQNIPNKASEQTLIQDRFDLEQLSIGLRVAIALGLIGSVLFSAAKASEFSHHAQKHEIYLTWSGVTLHSAATLGVILDSFT